MHIYIKFSAVEKNAYRIINEHLASISSKAWHRMLAINNLVDSRT